MTQRLGGGGRIGVESWRGVSGKERRFGVHVDTWSLLNGCTAIIYNLTSSYHYDEN